MANKKLLAQQLLFAILVFCCTKHFAAVIYVHAGAYQQLENARKILTKVQAHTQHSVELVRQTTPSASLYYVIVSGFDGLSEAKRVQVRLKKFKVDSWIDVREQSDTHLYSWHRQPLHQAVRIEQAHQRLEAAVKDPEFMLEHWISMPVVPEDNEKKIFRLSLQEAILLALRYNPNIQHQALERIVQRYNLYKAHNDLELQYALSGNVNVQKTRISNVNSDTQSYLLTPELRLKTAWGTEYTLDLKNNYDNNASYGPMLEFNVKQPLLRNAGTTVNTQRLLDAIDNEMSNKLQLRQTVIDQVTAVINTYRNVIRAKQALSSIKQQLNDAMSTLKNNAVKIKAGQLERTGNIQPSYQIESLKIQVVGGENALKKSELELTKAIGLNPELKLIVDKDVGLKKITVPNMSEAIEDALVHNTHYIQKKIALKKTERAYQVALNQQLWQLDLTGDVATGALPGVLPTEKNSFNIFSGKNISGALNLQLTVPINDVAVKQQLINAKIYLEQARIKLTATKRDLINQIKNLIYSIQASASAYKLALRQQTLAQQSYQLEKKKQNAGIASALDVSNTQNQLLNAQITTINAKIAYLNQITALNQSLGITLKQWNIKLRYGE